MTRATLHAVNIRPHVGVFSVFEAVDYKAWYAIAEFVDNAVQSFLEFRGRWPGAPSLVITIDTDAAASRLTITDNAGGISLERFSGAFEVGKPAPNPKGLSVYGVGLKSAAAWFAESLTVSTVAYGEQVRRSLTLDFAKIVSEGNDVIPVAEETASAGQHGTTLTLERLRHPLHPKTRDKVARHLSEMYREFLRRGDIEIQFLGTALEHAEPEVLTAPFFRDEQRMPVRWHKALDITLSTGERVHGFAAIRRTGRTAGSGFSLFRSGRVITGLDDDPWRPVEIFGYGNSYRSQRVFGELHVEGVRVAYSKNGFVWRASEEELIESLRSQLDDDSMPLLKQAEGYRAREPEPEQATAAKKAFNETAGALEGALARTLVERGPLPKESAPEELPEIPQQLATRTFVFLYNNHEWHVSVELVSEDSQDWLVLSESERVEGTLLPGRSIGIRINLNTPFMRRFGGKDASEIEGTLRIAAAVAVAVIVARQQGVRHVDSVLGHINYVLSARLSS